MKKRFRIDLFSDTNCSVSDDMRAFMCDAEVGNEVAGEDPTVNLLLERVCDLIGKEAAVFFPSGSMCNALAFRTWCRQPGNGIILEKTAHPFLKIPSMFSGFLQAQPILIHGERGKFQANQLESVMRQEKYYSGYNDPKACLVSVENPTNYGGGAIWTVKQLTTVCEVAKAFGIPTHMDGARLLLAQEKTGIPAKDYAKPFDSVFIDFCKIVGAPMGAVLCGTKDFIDAVWFHKFQIGGYMHKAGILAAACLYGLDHNLKKIPTVLKNTQLLAQALSDLPFIKINMEHVETNVILMETTHEAMSAYDFESKLKKLGIRVHAYDLCNIRLMLHFDIDSKDITDIRNAFEAVGNSDFFY
jgi:threonine aldolase